METNGKLKSIASIDSNIWTRDLKKDGTRFCFATALDLASYSDLTSLAQMLPDGAVACDASMIAGMDHLEQVLIQASELWDRNGEIARKKSIDLLMRITCQRQISEAVTASKLTRTNSVAVFGVVSSRDQIEKSLGSIRSRFPTAKVDGSLLSLTKKKEIFLKKFHNLPDHFSANQLVVALREKSALLVFSN